MQFHGIGREEHSAQAHHVTNCMHDHPHFKMEGETARASSAQSQGQQLERSQGEGQLTLSAWLERTLSKGKSLLRNFWGSSEENSSGEPGDKSGQAQPLYRPDDSREAAEGRSAATGPAQPDASALQAAHVAQAVAAVPQPRVLDAAASAAQAGGEREENPWQKIKVRFQDMAGRLKGQLQKNAFGFQTKSSLSARQDRPRQEPRKAGRARRDAVEIDSYRVEESYLLDSYDRKGGYSKISTKK